LQRATVKISFKVEGGAEQHRTARYTSKQADLGPMAALFPPGKSAMDFTWIEFTRLEIDGASFLDAEWVYNQFQVLNPPPVRPAKPWDGADQTCSARSAAPHALPVSALCNVQERGA
jgi:hypothetical protein